MEFGLTIDIDNEAFQPYPADEVARILGGIVETIVDSGVIGDMTLVDSNGNTVGKMYVKESPEVEFE